MIGYNIFTSVHQTCQLVALMEGTSFEQEALNFCRGGAVHIPLNSVIIVIENDKCYEGYGLAPIQSFTEGKLIEILEKHRSNFSAKLHEVSKGAVKIACVTVEKYQKVAEDGAHFGKHIGKNEEDDEHLQGDQHAYVFHMEPGSGKGKPIYKVYDDTSRQGMEITEVWLGNIIMMELYEWTKRCSSRFPDRTTMG